MIMNSYMFRFYSTINGGCLSSQLFNIYKYINHPNTQLYTDYAALSVSILNVLSRNKWTITNEVKSRAIY